LGFSAERGDRDGEQPVGALAGRAGEAGSLGRCGSGGGSALGTGKAHRGDPEMTGTMRRILWVALFAAVASAQGPLVDAGYEHFYNLEYPEAISLFEQAVAQHPGDP